MAVAPGSTCAVDDDSQRAKILKLEGNALNPDGGGVLSPGRQDPVPILEHLQDEVFREIRQDTARPTGSTHGRLMVRREVALMITLQVESCCVGSCWSRFCPGGGRRHPNYERHRKHRDHPNHHIHNAAAFVFADTANSSSSSNNNRAAQQGVVAHPGFSWRHCFVPVISNASRRPLA